MEPLSERSQTHREMPVCPRSHTRRDGNLARHPGGRRGPRGHQPEPTSMPVRMWLCRPSTLRPTAPLIGSSTSVNATIVSQPGARERWLGTLSAQAAGHRRLDCYQTPPRVAWTFRCGISPHETGNVEQQAGKSSPAGRHRLPGASWASAIATARSTAGEACSGAWRIPDNSSGKLLVWAHGDRHRYPVDGETRRQFGTDGERGGVLRLHPVRDRVGAVPGPGLLRALGDGRRHHGRVPHLRERVRRASAGRRAVRSPRRPRRTPRRPGLVGHRDGRLDDRDRTAARLCRDRHDGPDPPARPAPAAGPVSRRGTGRLQRLVTGARPGHRTESLRRLDDAGHLARHPARQARVPVRGVAPPADAAGLGLAAAVPGRRPPDAGRPGHPPFGHRTSGLHRPRRVRWTGQGTGDPGAVPPRTAGAGGGRGHPVRRRWRRPQRLRLELRHQPRHFGRLRIWR